MIAERLFLTNICFSHWYARNSAAVSASLGVMILSMVGSLARLRNKQVPSIDPFSSKSCE